MVKGTIDIYAFKGLAGYTLIEKELLKQDYSLEIKIPFVVFNDGVNVISEKRIWNTEFEDGLFSSDGRKEKKKIPNYIKKGLNYLEIYRKNWALQDWENSNKEEIIPFLNINSVGESNIIYEW